MAFAAVLLCTVFVSCTESLESFVDRAKDKLPTEIGDGQVLKDIIIKNEYLQFEVEYDEHEFRLDDRMFDKTLEAMGDEIHKMFIQEGYNNNMQELFEKCVDENKGIRFIMEGTKSKRNLTLCEISAEELKAEIRTK